MAKPLKDILAGVKKSKVVPGSTGTDPGVDYAPKAKAEQDFVAQHSTEKHEDRVGNGDEVYKGTTKYSLDKEEKHGHKRPKDKEQYDKVSESLAVPLIGSNGDGDESAEMAKTELKALANKAMHLVASVPDSMVIEPWVQSKIAKAKEMISSVHDYMVYGDHEEQTAPYEGGIDMSSGTVRNTFPNFSADVNTGRNV
jgi:hypothetical protein